MIPFSARFAFLLLLGALIVAGFARAEPEGRASGLVEGPVAISFKQRKNKTVYGPSKATLVMVWRYDGNNPSNSAYRWLEKQYGNKANHTLELKIDRTPYSMLIIDGVVRPLLLVQSQFSSQSSLWMIKGLEDYCSNASLIDPSRGTVTLARRLGDAHSRLLLDFSNGCKISYDEAFHGI